MNRWIMAMQKQAPPAARLTWLISQLNGINDKYDCMFKFDESFHVIVNTSFSRKDAPRSGGSLITVKEPSYIGQDKALLSMEHDMSNLCLVYGTLRYFNLDLTDMERAVIASKYFRACQRQVILNRYCISKREYYKMVDTAEEKLIELWRLDSYDELGIILSNTVINKRRMERTGIKGGYFAQHPEWELQFYKK